MQLRSPEAAGHATAFRIEIAALEQINLPGATAGLVGQCLDGIRDTQRHVGAALMRVHTIAVGIVGGDEHEHRLSVIVPCEHRRIGPFHSKRHRIDRLANAACNGTGLAGFECSFGGFAGQGFKLRRIPVHRTRSPGTIAVGEFGTSRTQRQYRGLRGFPAQGRVGMLRRNGRANVADAPEPFRQTLRFRFADGNDIARYGMGDTAIAGISKLLRLRLPYDVKRILRTSLRRDIARLRGI